MSDSRHSYYEIALTNRQALVAFAVLLGAVLIAFFAGVWVARSEPDAPALVEGAPAPLGSAPLRPEPQLARVAEAADTSTTLVEDVSGKRPAAPSTSAATEPATAAEGEPVIAEPEAGEPGASLARAAEPEPIQAASQPAATPPAEPSPPRPVISEPTTGFIIQVMATADLAKAEGLVRRLEAAGYSAYPSPTGSGATRTYRVRIGPYTTREKADQDAARVDRQFKVESWVTIP